MDSKPFCPLKVSGPFLLPDGEWKEIDGVVRCTYCGSIHNEVFLKHLRTVVQNPDPDYRIELNDRGNKIYIHRPGPDGKDQQLKYYIAHLRDWCIINEVDPVEMYKRVDQGIDISRGKFSIISALFEEKLRNNMF